MGKKTWIFAFAALWLLGASTLWAQGYPWKDHAFPYDFLFGNHIDTHQQTRLQQSGDLFGFLYITYTGAVSAEGLPVAEHCDGDTPARQCTVGWILRGKPGHARFVYHMNDHPIWLVAGRSEIPQPGAYSHFHWYGRPEHPDGQDGLVAGQEYPGYFLELQAVKSFAFLHAGEWIPVYPGLDIATHVNIVASFPGY